MSARSASISTQPGKSLRASSGRPAAGRKERRRLFFEGLEDRCLLAFNVLAEYDTGLNPQDIDLTQINAGSQLDMVVANGSSTTVGVRLGNGDGTFASVQNAAASSNPHAVAAGDFTSDGIPDLVTANTSEVSLLVGNGDGTFQPPVSIPLPGLFPPGYAGTDPRPQTALSIATGDLNADGKLDIAVGADTYFNQLACYYGYYGGSYCYYFATYDGYVNVLLGNGAGGFGAAETQHLGAWRFPNAVEIGNIDSDSHADVITANSYDLSVLLGDGSGSVGSPNHTGSGYALRSISLGDVDGDGKVDTLLSSGYGLSVQKGDGLGNFTAQPSVSTGNTVNSAVIGDVNADGKLDLVAVGADNQFHCTSYGYWGCYDGNWTSSRHATVLLGNGAGGFSLPLTSSLGGELNYSYVADVAVADLTGDGLPELATIDYYFNKAIVARNDGIWNPPPSIVISDAAVTEGNAGTVNLEFTVTVIGTHAGVSVDFATANDTATAGADYTTSSGKLTFGIGESSKKTSIPVQGDTLDEYDEQFYVTLSNAVGGQISDSQAIGTILDDDAPPQLTIGDVSKSEGNHPQTTSFNFPVSLSEASGKWVSVNYVTADGTATAASDYHAASGTLWLAPGQTSGTIAVTVIGDDVFEANETFNIHLSNASDAVIARETAVATILNDDAGISINDVSRLEGRNGVVHFTFTVTLSAPSTKQVKVDYATSNGTALSGSDYNAATGTLTFAPGEISKTIIIKVKGDRVRETDETFFVNLSGAINAVILDDQGVGTILNDD